MAVAAITFIDLLWHIPLVLARGEKSRLTMFLMEVLMCAGTKQAKLGLFLRLDLDIPFVFLHALKIQTV